MIDKLKLFVLNQNYANRKRLLRVYLPRQTDARGETQV